MLKATGVFRGRAAALTWDGGAWSGDPEAAAAAAALEGDFRGAAFGSSYPASDADAALAAALRVLPGGTVGGDLPAGSHPDAAGEGDAHDD